MQRAQANYAADTDTLGDADLVRLAQQGDPAAFRAIMGRHNRRLYRVARSVLTDDSEAEDVVQEDYIRAFAGLAGFRGEASLSTWLTRITLNEALGRLRRRRPTVELAALDDGHNPRSSLPSCPSRCLGRSCTRHRAPEMTAVGTAMPRAVAIGVLVSASLLCTGLLAHEHATGIVKERMEGMASAGKALKAIIQRVKARRGLEGIPEHAQHISETAAKIPGWFPPGSTDRPTEAKAAIWEQWPDFEARARQLVSDSDRLRAAAELGDAKAVAATVHQVAETCSSCHDKYVRK